MVAAAGTNTFVKSETCLTRHCRNQPTYSCHQSVRRSTHRTLCFRSNRSRVKSQDERASFRSILDEYDEVFDPNYAGYNGHVGPFEAVVNMGPVQPLQRKGHLPQHARNQLVDLQGKFDELETMSVFVRPKMCH